MIVNRSKEEQYITTVSSNLDILQRTNKPFSASTTNAMPLTVK
jgi:hypothetical protein